MAPAVLVDELERLGPSSRDEHRVAAAARDASHELSHRVLVLGESTVSSRGGRGRSGGSPRSAPRRTRGKIDPEGRPRARRRSSMRTKPPLCATMP